jgi:uncharacterized protein YjbI with pentapeptide repeats
MRTIPQFEFEALIKKQQACTGEENLHDFNVANADLTEARFVEKDLSGTSIAMSRLQSVKFDATFDLHGVSWIGNEIQECIFDGVSMNKCEVLDCVLEGCSLVRVSLFRADWSGSSFENCRLTELNLSQKVSLFGVAFRSCTFDKVKLGDGRTLRGVGTLVFGVEGNVVEERLASI